MINHKLLDKSSLTVRQPYMYMAGIKSFKNYPPYSERGLVDLTRVTGNRSPFSCPTPQCLKHHSIIMPLPSVIFT